MNIALGQASPLTSRGRCQASDRGRECLLIEDAAESYFPEFKRARLEMVRAQGGIVGGLSRSPRSAQPLGRGVRRC